MYMYTMIYVLLAFLGPTFQSVLLYGQTVLSYRPVGGNGTFALKFHVIPLRLWFLRTQTDDDSPWHDSSFALR